MLPVNNLINQIFFGSYQWDIYNQRFSSSIPVDRVTGPGQTQIGYWSDSQLWQTIAWSRFAYERNPVVKGIINILIDHIGKPHVEWVGDKSLARKVNKLWEKFSRVNCLGDSGYLTTGELSQDREKEIRVRWLRDGEVFIRFFVKDIGYPLVLRFVEPEQVRTPPIDRDEKFSHTWGIVTEIDDNENIRGYWVYYPNQGEWDYVHRRYMVYGRRNADRNVKRGLPEIANLELDFAHLWQLLRGVTITSKAQASIAWIEKYPGAMLEQILAHSISTKDTGTTSFGPFKPGTPNLSPSFYGVDPNAKAIDPGTILSVNQGKEYEPGPTSDPQKYIDACASILHLLSLQWCLPDWITKGPEAYASALVSGSPFVRRIESMQADYAAIFGQLCTTFVRLAERLGWLERKTLQKVQPVVRLPSVIMADEIKQVETLQKELQSGLLSEIEYLHKRGRDPRKTLAQRKKWRELLSKYGVGSEQQGVFEDKEKTKPKKFRDYLNPPGSRILREEECEKENFDVMRKLTGECETVQRCSGWKPGDKSPYVLGCEHGDMEWRRPSTGGKPSPQVSQAVSSITKDTTKLMEEIYAKAARGKPVDHNKRQQLMGQVTHLSSSIVTLGFLEELSSYPTKVKREVMKQLALAVQGDEKANKLFETEVLDRTSDNDLDKLISNAVEVVKGEIDDIKQEFYGSNQSGKDKKKSAAAPILDIIAQTAIDNLKDSIGKGKKITLPEGTQGKQEIEYAMSRMDFTPDNIPQFLGGAMTLGSIEHQMQEHQKVMLRSSLLKTLAGRIPYLQDVQVDKKLSEFAFESFVAVNERAYAKIMSKIDGIVKDNIPTPQLEKLLHRVMLDCHNVYGEIGDNREIRKKLIRSIYGIKDEVVKRKVINSILLRCIFSYGAAEIARRGNEEAWARLHGAGMAYNPQFPGIDNVLTMKNDDGTYSIIPMSHKMHMTEGSNTAAKEFAKMNTIKGLIEKHKGRIERRIQISLRRILGNKPEERIISLNRYIDRLERKLRRHDCNSVDWGSSNSENRDICFKLDYSRMILSSLSRHIVDMPRDGYKINYKPITLVRFRAKNIEFYEEGNSKAIAIYERNGYETREDMIRNSVDALRLGKVVKTRQNKPRRKKKSSDNNSQVQQPKT